MEMLEFDILMLLSPFFNQHTSLLCRFVSESGLLNFNQNLSIMVGVLPPTIRDWLRQYGCTDPQSVIRELRSLIINSVIKLMLRRQSVQQVLSSLQG